MENQQINSNMQEEKEIDLIALISGLWARRKNILITAAVGAVVGLVVGFSIPKEFTSGAKLAPEASSSSNALSGMGGIASMMGINVGSGNAGGDAISTNLYPDVVSSIPFITELFPVEISTLDGEIQTTLYDYMLEEQKSPWWSHVISAPFKVLGFVINIFSGKEDEEVTTLDIEALTNEQFGVYNALKERISIAVDTKTFVISLSVKMQDPKVAADVAKIVLENLQTYILSYRTQKVKNDLAYAQETYDAAKERYYLAQRLYATFEDENKNITSSRYRTEQELLRNDMTLAYNIYTSLAGTLEDTKLRLQKETPIYVILEPVTRPLKRSEPNKMLILIAFIFLAGVGSSAYYIFKDKLIEL